MGNATFQTNYTPSKQPKFPWMMDFIGYTESGYLLKRMGYRIEEVEDKLCEFNHFIHDHRKGKVISNKKNFEDSAKLIKILFQKVSLESFKLIKELGNGSQGKVMLVRLQNIHNAFFALKEIRKSQVSTNENLKHLKIEKFVLQENDSPFLAKCFKTFQTNSHLYFVMEFISGGNMLKNLADFGPFDEETTAFYIGEVVLGLEYLHKNMEIIYLDLKLENILLTEEGHIKLTDFGISELINEKDSSYEGTPEYMSPELVRKENFGFETDLWSLGVLIYELLCGFSPFRNKGERNPRKILERILSLDFEMPDYLSQNAKSIILSLMKEKPDKRLGSNSFEEIKSHEFFSNVDFLKLSKLEIVPKIKKPLLLCYHRSGEIKESLSNETLPSFDYF